MIKGLSMEELNKLSEKYGDAFYLLDSDNFIINYEELSRAFKKYYPKFNIAYSYKTNYIPKLVKIVDELGGFAEVVSDMEMEIALRSGVNPKKIIWNGPIKNKDKVEQLLVSGGTVNIDSINEIEYIKNILMEYPELNINLGVRCNYDVGDGVLSRFGFDVESNDFDKVMQFIKNSKNITLINLQSHFAKRNPAFWSNRAQGILEIYDIVVSRYGLRPRRLDIGGGIFGKMPLNLRRQLGIENYSFDDYASRAGKKFAEYFNGYDNPPILLIEPGTALAGNCMSFICKVETIKEVQGKKIATVLGSQKNISMNGINPPIEIIHNPQNNEYIRDVDLVGYTCIENDIIYKNYSGLLSVGDYVVISNCGSYSIVMKPPFILPNFYVLDLCGDNVEVIKRAETFEDLFGTYVFE